MSDEPSPPPDPGNLELDLAQSFAPAWARESDSGERLKRLAEKHGGGEREERPRGRRDDHGPRSDRRPARGAGDKRSERRGDRRDDRRPERRSEPEPVLSGWELQFLPDRHGMDGLAGQIKAGAKAYPLFDLARLILEKPERYLVEFKSASGPGLFQLRADGSLWLGASEAVAHAMAHCLEKFYRRERVSVEPPKGAYPFVAECGMSGVLLGPPNYHDYQMKLRKLHAERFANVPFAVYQSRIRMVRDEAAIQKWKDEQSARDEFYPAESAEGAEPVRLGTLAEVEAHFRQHHAPGEILSVAERVVIPGPAALNGSAPAVRRLARGVLDELQRFPLPMAHTLGRQLASKGLQIFKAHENITYVSVARPRHLDREATPVSDAVRGILEYLEGHSGVSRAEQWKALVALRPCPEEEGAQAAREAAVASDLSWLLHEGHVIDYARRGLEAARRPQPRIEREVNAGTAE